MGSTALLTDYYELTMLQAALRSGVASHRSVFEVFARRLPAGRRYAVACGLGRLIEALADFRFRDAELGYLGDHNLVDDPTLDWLARYRFSGSIDAYAEGEVFFPGSPIVTVEGPFADAVLLETLVLSIFNHDSAVASAAARMACAACGRGLVEMGGRRTHESAAVASARAAYIAGFTTTSNLEAGRRYGIPVAGTSAHAFTLVHPDEETAFRTQVGALGPGTTLLVDTYDTDEGVRRAIAVAGTELGAVRLDSGDPLEEAPRVRRLLNELGAYRTRIVVTGDLEEHSIARLAAAPIDGYGVGTCLVSGSGAPTAELVFKLVARADEPGDDAPLRPVEKRSKNKHTRGGRKTAWRRLDDDGYAVAEIVIADSHPAREQPGRPLQVRVVDHGEIAHAPTLDDVRKHHAASRAELRPEWLRPDDGPPALTATSEVP